jgi:hypothetical protein
MSTNRKDKNAWRTPLMETYLTSIMIMKKMADFTGKIHTSAFH